MVSSSGAHNLTYGVWRTDVPQEPGYSRELVHAEMANIKDWDTVFNRSYDHGIGVNTLLKAFDACVHRHPDKLFLGNRRKDG